MEPQEVTGQANSLVSQDWERELMDAGNDGLILTLNSILHICMKKTMLLCSER